MEAWHGSREPGCRWAECVLKNFSHTAGLWVTSRSTVHDFNSIPHLIEYALKDVMHCAPSEHPVLVTEPTWNTPASREKMAELMFEEFQVPAFYIANTGVLNAYAFFFPLLGIALFISSSFAAGKGTALVIDVGKSMASVTPVVDGFVLRKGEAAFA